MAQHPAAPYAYAGTTLDSGETFAGWLFVFRGRRGTAIKALYYDGQGFYLVQKRLSTGRFRYWPGNPSEVSMTLEAHELQVDPVVTLRQE